MLKDPSPFELLRTLFITFHQLGANAMKFQNEKKRKGKELPKEAKIRPQLAKERKVTACRNTEEVKPSISNVVSGDSRHISCGMEAHGAFLKTNDSDEVIVYFQLPFFSPSVCSPHWIAITCNNGQGLYRSFYT